jgi:guanylate kinase
MRSNESQGMPYIFTSKQEFQALATQGGLLEWQRVHDDYYGTSRTVINKFLDENLDVISDIEVQGAHEILLKMPFTSCSVFIIPPNQDELLTRIIKRHPESEEEIDRRLKRANIEVSMASSFDYLICNDDLDKATETLLAIISAHRARRLKTYFILNQKQLPVFRTISFHVPVEDPKDAQSQHTIALPKTRLSETESYEAALSRVIRLISLSKSIPLEENHFSISARSEHMTQHDVPIPYIELETHCNITVNSISRRDEIYKAFKFEKAIL